MFVAASTRCFAHLSFEDACHQISELEYDKVELWLDENGHLTPSEVASNPEAFYSNYREITRLTPVAFSLAQDVNPEDFGQLVKIAKKMRAMQITIPSSPLGTPFNTEIDRLRAFHKIASEHGVRVSMKTETGQLTQDPHTAVELCQSVKGLGITLDPSYYLCGHPNNQFYDQVFPYTYHVHLRDSSPNALQVMVGLGEIDYNRIISMLRQYDYNWALSVEFLPEHTDLEQLPLEMRKIRMLLETLL